MNNNLLICHLDTYKKYRTKYQDRHWIVTNWLCLYPGKEDYFETVILHSINSTDAKLLVLVEFSGNA